jgi:hypothetical protein
MSKMVIQYSLQGEHIAHFASLTEAAKAVKSTPSQIFAACCTSKYKANRTAAGFQWRLFSHTLKISPYIPCEVNSPKGCKQYDTKGLLIKSFPSLGEAARQTGIQRSGISKCCSGRLLTSGGYIWKYNWD